ncbi:MAG: hypothetical protein CMJ85_06900 [Planctomycetes bacterium]|jgi:hypothetical protein|nr:hypothetical protein [Planctomycetota bacterium]
MALSPIIPTARPEAFRARAAVATNSGLEEPEQVSHGSPLDGVLGMDGEAAGIGASNSIAMACAPMSELVAIPA